MDCKYIRECFAAIEDTGTKSLACRKNKCLKYCDCRKSIVVEENKKRYELTNAGHEIAVFQVDGEMVDSNNVIKCDNLVLAGKDNIAVFVELKGTDLKHAFEQIDNTRKMFQYVLRRYQLYGRIVTSNRTNVPNMRTNPQYVALQKEFLKRNGNIRIGANRIQEKFEDL